MRSLLFLNRFKKPLERITLALLGLYLFLDVAYKFKMVGQSRKIGLTGQKLPLDRSEVQNDMDLFRDNSIFELYVYNSELRMTINSLIGESILRIIISVTLLGLFYKMVFSG